jgi:glucokinase
MAWVLAGDMGGTSTRLALYDLASARAWLADPRQPPQPFAHQVLPSRDFGGLEALCAAFLRDAGGHAAVVGAALGVAGPVVEGRCVATNLPWVIDAASLSDALGGVPVSLCNDLEALALGTLVLPEGATVMLQQGVRRRGTIAVLAAGTGLGQAQLFWDGERHHAGATEGGHVEFAPEHDEDAALLDFTRARLVAGGYGTHVSWERLVSGMGLCTIAAYLREIRGLPFVSDVDAALAAGGDAAAAAIGRAALAGHCPASLRAARWMVRLLGRQAGNWALSLMALGGVQIGGGIAGKLLPLLREPAFLAAFADKGRYRPLMDQLPVAVVSDPLAGLYGALALALQRTRDT